VSGIEPYLTDGIQVAEGRYLTHQGEQQLAAVSLAQAVISRALL
jgi:hypothetical protein